MRAMGAVTARRTAWRACAVSVLMATLAGCGVESAVQDLAQANAPDPVASPASGGDAAPAADRPAPAPVVAPGAPSLTATVGVKKIDFGWTDTAGATSYQLQKQVAGGAWTDEGAAVAAPALALSRPLASHLTDWSTTRYRVKACNAGGCGESAAVDLASQMLQSIGYLKPSNPRASNRFGGNLALSADGTTLVVTHPNDDSAATGVNGNDQDTSAADSGAAHVFVRTDGGWVQQAYLKASNTQAGDTFGLCVGLSADGSTIVVGANLEDSSATGVDGDPSDNSATNSGAAYVFVRSGGTWTQQAYLKASNTDASDNFGARCAISGDGSTILVGAPLEDSAATGIGGNQADNTSASAGAVYVFVRNGATWAQQAYLKASNTGAGDQFGFRVALNADGTTAAIGAHGEDSAASGVNGDQADNTAADSGAVYVFTRTGATWTQQAYLKAGFNGAGDSFGRGLSLSESGDTLVVAARADDASASGVDGDGSNNALADSGGAYVFERTGGTWVQTAYLKASNPGAGDLFGAFVSISGDGSVVAIGSYEDGGGLGVGANQADESTTDAGAVYVYGRAGAGWIQKAYVKPRRAWSGHNCVVPALSRDGGTLAVGCDGDPSSATGFGGDLADTSTPASGAVFVY